MSLSRSCCALLFVLCAVPVQAATYWVSATTGNDSRSCATSQTESTPRLTIMKGLECVSAGDTLNIREGTYAESLELYGWPSLSFGGTLPTSWANAITVTAYNSETVIIQPPSTKAFILVMRGSSAVATDAPRYVNWTGIVFDGTNISSHGVYVTAWDASASQAPAHHHRFTDFTIRNVNSGQGLLTTWGSDGVELLGTCSGLVCTSKIHDIDGPTPEKQNTQCVYGGAHDMIVQGLQIYNCWGYGISNINSNSAVPSGAALNVNNHTIAGNRVYNNGLGGTGLGGINLGEGSGHRIYNNVVYGNAGPPLLLRFGDGSNTTYVVNNTIVDNGGDYCIEIGFANINAQVYNNICYGNTSDTISDGNISGKQNDGVGLTGTDIGTNVLGTDPTFVDAGNDDYSIQAGSSARNTGTTFLFVADDIAALSRPSGAAYDIGAFEYDEGGCVDSNTLPHTFTGSNGTSIASANCNWSVGVGAFQIQSNQFQPNDAAESFGRWTAIIYSPNQYSQIEIEALVNLTWVGHCVRLQVAVETGYCVFVDQTGSADLIRYDAGVQFVLYTDPTTPWVANDISYLSMVGTTWTWKRNGSTEATDVDATYPDGWAGISGFGNGASRGDNFTAGSVGAVRNQRMLLGVGK